LFFKAKDKGYSHAIYYIDWLHLCLRCVAFFKYMIRRPIMSQKFSGDSRLLPRFTYIPKIHCVRQKWNHSIFGSNFAKW